MAFGLSFGAKKGSQTTTSNVDKTVTGTQASSGTQTQQGTTTNTGNTSTQQSGSATGSTTNQQATTGQQQTTQQGTAFSAPTLSALDAATQQLLGGVGATPAKLDTGFNGTEFVNKGMEAARSQVSDQLDTALNGIFDTVGGRDNQNSMATLLATKARGEAGAQLSGDYANLTANANQIERENFNANVGAQSSQNNLIEGIVSALKGGATTTTGNVATSENTAATGTSAQNTNQTGTQASSNTQVQDLVTAITQLLSSNEHTVGTETDKTKTSSMGGGFSLGL